MMSTFSLRATREQKLRFAYQVRAPPLPRFFPFPSPAMRTNLTESSVQQVYDADNDGKISKEDLRRTLKTIVRDSMDEDDFLEEVLQKVRGPPSTSLPFHPRKW